MVTLGTTGGILLALTLHPAFALIPLAYMLLCFGWGIAAALRSRDLCLAAMGAAAAAMHHSWAFGFLSGLIMRMPHSKD